MRNHYELHISDIIVISLLVLGVFGCAIHLSSLTAHAADAEQAPDTVKCVIFRDSDTAKIGAAVNNFLATKPVVVQILQSEGMVLSNVKNYPSTYTSTSVVTITIFYKEKP